jgi:hypothetical protein
MGIVARSRGNLSDAIWRFGVFLKIAVNIYCWCGKHFSTRRARPCTIGGVEEDSAREFGALVR